MPVTPNRELDLLLLIDDSPGGSELQDLLSTAFSVLVDQLSPDGELVNLHLGVATSDLGTTGSDDPSQPGAPIGQLGNGGCAGHGKDGKLITSGAMLSEAFLIDEAGPGATRLRNYQGTLASVAGQMIKAGGGGCGFEQHFAAIRRTLTNPANAGFLRPDAQLGVVIVADEDDCSFRTPRLLDVNEPLGPLQSFRCTQQGIVCNEPMDVGAKTGCRTREDSTYVEGLAPTIELLRGLKADPSLVTVGALAAPPTPFEIELRTPPGGGTAISSLANSCDIKFDPIGSIRAMDPAVRMRDLAAAFDAHGLFLSGCTPVFDAQVRALGRVFKQNLGVACLDTSILRDSDTASGIQPTCGAVTVIGGVEEPLPACPADGACFEIVADAAACADTSDHLRFVVHDAPPGAFIRARCEVP